MSEEKEKPNNPEAFPIVLSTDDFSPGMSLRDYFAAKSAPQILSDWQRHNMRSGRPYDFNMNGGDADNIAEQAYLLADSMLKMRNEKA